MRRITLRSCRGQNFHTFEIPDPDLSIHFAIFMALRSRYNELSAKLVHSRINDLADVCACTESRMLRMQP